MLKNNAEKIHHTASKYKIGKIHREKFKMAKRVFEKEITERDIKILEGLAQGMNDREIAEVIGFSYQTVNASFTKIMLKLGAVNKYNALYLAVKRKLIK